MSRHIERLVLDESVPHSPETLAEVERRIGRRPAEITVVAEQYPGLPDALILDRLMDARSMLVTQDRPLHNAALDRGFASLLRRPDSGWTQKRCGRIAPTAPLPSGAPTRLEDNLLPELSPEAAAIAGILSNFRSEKAEKQLRTKRRRIRAHFGTPANIGPVALTVGQRRTGSGMVGGYKLKVDAHHGTKGLFPASEGYFRDGAGHPLLAIAWALSQLYGLHLHDRALTIYALDTAAGERCAALTAEPRLAADAIERMTVRLLAEIPRVAVLPCRKGRFFDQMAAKLDEVARGRGNELVSVDLGAIAAALACRG